MAFWAFPCAPVDTRIPFCRVQIGLRVVSNGGDSCSLIWAENDRKTHQQTECKKNQNCEKYTSITSKKRYLRVYLRSDNIYGYMVILHIYIYIYVKILILSSNSNSFIQVLIVEAAPEREGYRIITRDVLPSVRDRRPGSGHHDTR